jgi:HlyD family secretion protein
MKKFFKIFGLTLLAVVFVGTFVFLYNKSQAKPDVFEIQSLWLLIL